MSTDRIVVIANNGALSIGEGDDSPYTRDGRMYYRPTTLAELAKKWPTLYDAMLVALIRFKTYPEMKSSDWVIFSE
jgi:hypothetical protein